MIATLAAAAVAGCLEAAAAQASVPAHPMVHEMKTFEPYPRDPGDEEMPYWWSALEFEGFVAAAWTHEGESDGTDVEGPKLIYGLRGSGDDLMGMIDGWISVRKGGDLEIYGLGAELVPILFYRPWFGLGPILNAGLEYRTESPHQGYGGFFGVGGEVIFWLGRHWQVTLEAERDFGIGTHSGNQLGFSVGFGHRRLSPAHKGPPTGDI